MDPEEVTFKVSREESSPKKKDCNEVKQVEQLRSKSIPRFLKQMQRVWKRAPSRSRDQGFRTSVNLEALANQKRQWYQIHSHSQEFKQQKTPESLFEHLLVIGLHSSSSVESVGKMARFETSGIRKPQYLGNPPMLQPQVLFTYPPGRLSSRMEKDLADFCFPCGIEANLVERTPSMSDLNEVVFGQAHLARDDMSYIFSLKASDNKTLYGVCLHVKELVQRAPGILCGMLPPSPADGNPGRFLLSAPRCYCLVTRFPFFELHFEMLNSIISQDRLERIVQFANSMSLTDYVPRDTSIQSTSLVSADWMNSVLTASGVLGPTTPSSRKTLDKHSSPFSFRFSEPESPESGVTSETSDFAYTREMDKGGQRSPLYTNDLTSEGSELHCDSFDQLNGSDDNGRFSPTAVSSGHRFWSFGSMESIHSSVSSLRSDCDDDDVLSKDGTAVNDEKVMEWAKENSNEALQIVCRYHSLHVPARGSEIVFQPLEHLQPFRYSRPGVSALELSNSYSHVDISFLSDIDDVDARLGAAEEALALSLWSTSTICRALSLDSILALFAGVLLEKQSVIICPNLGVLSAIVFSLVPMIRPFEWQSLLLPVLPLTMFDFLEAPVPYILGIQHKPDDLKLKTSNLVRVDVSKDKVKMCSLPPLPRLKELVSELSPIHVRLSSEGSLAERHPVYRCSEFQAEAAHQFLTVLRNYLESLCSNLRSHTITNVRSSNDKVSLLLKESFISSFPSGERPFIKHFVETQMFSVLSDSRLLQYENERV